MIKNNFAQIWEPIAQDIKEQIITGKLKPAQRLKISEISTSYGVSNTPVREAFRHLATEGFVENIPRKTVIVKEITHKDIEGIYAIQELLEGLAARLSVRNLSEMNLKKLKNLQNRMQEYLQENNLDKFIKANQEFHQCIINTSGNEKLIQIVGNLRDHIQRFRSIMLRYPGRAEQAWKEHEKILEGFMMSDAEKCEEQVRNHIRNAGELLKMIIKQEQGGKIHLNQNET